MGFLHISLSLDFNNPARIQKKSIILPSVNL